MVLPNVSPGDPHAVAHNTERAEINKLVQGVNLPSRTSDRAFFPITKALSDGTARIVALGDSKTEGTGLERTTHRWINKLQDILRNQYGKTDTGFGYMPAKYGTFYDFQDGPVYEGTVTAFDSQTHGLGQRIAKLELGSTVTFPSMTFADGVPLTVHYIETGIYPAGEIEVLTDGVVRGTIATSGTGFSSQKATVSIPAGDAQVVLRPKAGTNPVYVEGIFNETSTSGIKVIDGSKSGAKFSQFNESASWNAVGMYEPHGYILAFGANDMSEKTPAQMAVDARAIVTRALNLSPLAGVVILHGSERTQTPQSGKVREFETVMRTEFADDPQVSILYESDLWLPKTGTDYTWGGPEGWLVDTVHTSASAHNAIAKYLASYMQPSTPAAQDVSWGNLVGKPTSFSPSGHKESHATGGSDPITPESIGAPDNAQVSGTFSTEGNSIPFGPGQGMSNAQALQLVLAVADNANNRADQAYPASGLTYTSHVDSLVAPGAFRISGSAMNAGNGYPWSPEQVGYVIVHRYTSAYVTQEVISENGTTWRRNSVAGSSTAWRSWTPIAVDTGWRVLPLENGWTGTLKVRWVNGQVYVTVRNLNGSAATNSNLTNSLGGSAAFHAGADNPAMSIGNVTSSTSAPSGNDIGSIGMTGGSTNQILRASSPTSGWTSGAASLSFAARSMALPPTLPGTPA